MKSVQERFDEVKALMVEIGRITLNERDSEPSIMDFISDEVTANGSAYDNEGVARFRLALETMTACRKYVESCDGEEQKIEAMQESKEDTFEAHLQTFFDGVKRIYREYIEQQFLNGAPFAGCVHDRPFSMSRGGRYVKVICDGSAFCFVDTESGNVLKPASWKSPAKHARGNIFDASNGLKHMGPHGPAYLR